MHNYRNFNSHSYSFYIYIKFINQAFNKRNLSIKKIYILMHTLSFEKNYEYSSLKTILQNNK